MSIDEPHLVAVSLSDTSDEILDVAESGPNGGAGFAGTEPGIDFELPLSGLLIGHEMEIQVEMLEITAELSPWSLNLDDLGVNFDLHAVRDIHGLG